MISFFETESKTNLDRLRDVDQSPNENFLMNILTIFLKYNGGEM